MIFFLFAWFFFPINYKFFVIDLFSVFRFMPVEVIEHAACHADVTQTKHTQTKLHMQAERERENCQTQWNKFWCKLFFPLISFFLSQPIEKNMKHFCVSAFTKRMNWNANDSMGFLFFTFHSFYFVFV